MSIEETYRWSSDPELLKSLLDAGHTIVVERGPTDVTTIRSAERWSLDKYWMVDYDGDNAGIVSLDGIRFLDPRPRPLEPSPLEWVHNDDETEAYCSFGLWSFMACSDGDWRVTWNSIPLVGENHDRGDMESAKMYVTRWWVNHLRSMIGG